VAGSAVGFRLGTRSVAFRVIALSTLWAVLALIVISTIISGLYRRTSEQGFRDLLSAHLFNLIGSIDVTPDGRLTGAPNLGDLRFSDPQSGWYWSVQGISDGLKGEILSPSMTRPIPVPPVSEYPFDADFQRHYQIEGLAGETIEVVESEFELDQRNQIARFRVSGNLSELEQDIRQFDRRLYSYLSLFGFGMIVINALAILFGLRPLARVSQALAQVREGTAQRLDGKFPSEIQPLADETNALIDNNRRIVERSRTQVGNLAHSLKTPLAVLLNEGRALGGAKGELIEHQAAGMQQQVEHYLQRARVAAQRDSVVYRTPVGTVLERMVRVMQKLKPGLNLDLAPVASDLMFAGEREDLEELTGNLVENALKWGRSKVKVGAVRLLSGSGAARFALTIEDDGPGIPEEKAREALKRGRRLDETKPGTGLGLAIVADLVSEYGGQIALEKSKLGGLEVVVQLPATE